MTPLPKRRWSTQRQGRKRATFKAVALSVSRCANCGEPKVSHTACPKCGFYRGREMIKIKVKKTSKTAEA